MGADQHIVMLPFMAHGHLIPFLALARQIQEKSDFKITIANTPLNIQYLRSTISKTSTNSNIHLAELSFCSTQHGLPLNTENTESISLSEMSKFFHASSSLEAPLRQLVSDITKQEGRPPLCIISDVFFGWAVNVAHSLGTKNISFTTCGAYGTMAYVSLWLNLPHRSTDSDDFAIPGFPENYRFHRTQLHKYFQLADGTDEWSKYFQPQILLSIKSDGWLCNTVEEIEPLGLEILRKYTGVPVWTIGPLLPPSALKKSSSDSSVSKHGAGKEPGMAAEKIVKWLNLQKEDSVVYVSFGSQNTISETQMMALAMGLEASGKPFIWVIRPPLGFDITGEFKSEWLPEGFEERIKESRKGLLVRNWAPQLEILSHKSVGVFLSHCGWNSVLESLSQGVPIIGWPLVAEQTYNSKMMMEEMGVNVELTRTVESVVSWKDVKKVIEMVLDGKGKGKEMKKKASKIAEKIRRAIIEEGEEQGSSLLALDHFLRTTSSSN
ncbi:Glycosyltransferase [Quillaja saponaria]|uniref:Glycosyltransferase n=1 Tax=Quillaja saponaria TaxID=32244 RepID=A0AAD7LFR2_QUISA|nr:Glycosyltransferase [Quillaja saponaria]